jgi:rod shape-determining protein MreD
MNVSAGAVARVAGLVLVGCVLQLSWIAAVRLFGATPDLVPLLVGAIALFAGAVPAAIAGFFCGLLIDLLVAQSVGASSLVLTLVGYGLGRYCQVRDPSHGLVGIPLAAAATLGYGAGLALVSFLLDRTSVSALAFQELVVAVLLNAALGVPVFALVRRVLRPVLTVDPLARRRRRRTVRERGPIGLRGLEV